MFDPILYISRLSGATKVYDIDNQSCFEDMQSPRGPRVLPFFCQGNKNYQTCFYVFLLCRTLLY